MKLKIKPGVNLEYAFELLKRKMDESEETFMNSNDELRGAAAFGTLKGTVTAVLNHCTEQETESDIPAGIFEKPGNNDLENTFN